MAEQVTERRAEKVAYECYEGAGAGTGFALLLLFQTDLGGVLPLSSSCPSSRSEQEEEIELDYMSP